MQGMQAVGTQLGYATGEIAKEFWGRVDIEAYGEACKICDNMEITPAGFITKRMGTILLDTSMSKLITLDFFDKTILIRKESPASYKIFSNRDGSMLFDWHNIPQEITFEELEECRTLVVSANKLMIAAKSGIYTFDKDGSVKKETLAGDLKDNIKDFSNSLIFKGSLVVVETDKVTTSKAGNLFDFTAGTGTQIYDAAFQISYNLPLLSGADVINAINYDGTIVMSTEDSIYRLIPTTIENRLAYIIVKVSSLRAVRNGLIEVEGTLYVMTRYGIFANTPAKISSDLAAGSVFEEKMELVSQLCSHAFVYEHKNGFIKRHNDNYQVFFSLRSDGAISCFYRYSKFLSYTRRTCFGGTNDVTQNAGYSWSSSPMTSIVSRRRLAKSNAYMYYSELVIIRNVSDDNQAINFFYELPYLWNFVFLDCSNVKSRTLNYNLTHVYSTSNPQGITYYNDDFLPEKISNIKNGDDIVINDGWIVTITDIGAGYFKFNMPQELKTSDSVDYLLVGVIQKRFDSDKYTTISHIEGATRILIGRDNDITTADIDIATIDSTNITLTDINKLHGVIGVKYDAYAIILGVYDTKSYVYSELKLFTYLTQNLYITNFHNRLYLKDVKTYKTINLTLESSLKNIDLPRISSKDSVIPDIKIAAEFGEYLGFSLRKMNMSSGG